MTDPAEYAPNTTYTYKREKNIFCDFAVSAIFSYIIFLFKKTYKAFL